MSDQTPRCIRDEQATRAEFPKWFGEGQPLDVAGVSRCGRIISGEWFFLNADHALYSMRPMGSVAVCHKCLKVIVEICREELKR